MEESGFYFALSLIIIRCTRGVDGVPWAIEYIVCHWSSFVARFASFCKNMVEAAERVSVQKGKTFLAHKDGLAASLSGLNFVKTLKNTECRDRLKQVARKLAPI